MNQEDLFSNLDYIREFGRPQLTPQQRIALAQSPHVTSYEMTANQGVTSPHLLAVDNDIDMGEGAMPGIGREAGSRLEHFGDDFIAPTMRLYGNHWEDFTNGYRELMEGRFPEIDSEALISLEIAELNNLSVGDEITLYSSMFLSGDQNNIRNINRNLTIVGIYFDMTDANALGGFFQNPFTNRRNEVLTTLDAVTGQMMENETGISVNATYYLHEPALLPLFESEARSLGVSTLLSLNTNEDEYNAIIQPVVGLKDVTFTFMVIVLILGAVVLILLSSIAIRERKYESGVLRAIGMKKWKVALGLWTEMLAITAVCLIIGLGAGTIVAQPISDTLLAVQVENATPQVDEGAGMFEGMGMFGGMGARMLGGGSVTEVQPLSELDVSLGLRTVMEIIVISLLLATVAGIAAILKITKYEPIKILMERD
jgi:putative ABC transport system permease protein